MHEEFNYAWHQFSVSYSIICIQINDMFLHVTLVIVLCNTKVNIIILYQLYIYLSN